MKDDRFEQHKLTTSLLRKDFPSFLEKVFYEVTGGKNFYNNWHIELYSKIVSDLITGKERKLAINVPPRSLKSICFSVALPAFVLGQCPNETFLCLSHNQELANKHAFDCLTVMNSPWYKRAHPETIISKKAFSASDFYTTRRGRRVAMGLDGGILGHGGNYIIVDDPNSSDDVSDERFDTINKKFTKKVLTRLDDKVGGRILVIMQRLHDNDLTGFLTNE